MSAELAAGHHGNYRSTQKHDWFSCFVKGGRNACFSMNSKGWKKAPKSLISKQALLDRQFSLLSYQPERINAGFLIFSDMLTWVTLMMF